MFAMVLSAKPNPVTFVSGDYSVLKNPDITLGIELDMSKLVLDDDNKSWARHMKEGGSDYARDWPEEKKKLEKYFGVAYNRKNKKGAKIDFDKKNAEYKIVIRPTSIHLGNRAAAAVHMFASSWVGGGESSLDDCQIIVVKRGGAAPAASSKKGKGKAPAKSAGGSKNVCTYSVGHMKGVSNISETIRIGVILSSMGTQFGKLVAKQ